KLREEIVDGHPCVKSRDVVTDDAGKSNKFIVWTATDLNRFPIKIQTEQKGGTMTLLFSNVKTENPDSSIFEPPADCKKYDSIQALIVQVASKYAAGGVPSANP